MPRSRSARAVPGPIAAIVGPASARASWTRASSCSAPLGLVTQIRSNCSSGGTTTSSGSIRIAGASTTHGAERAQPGGELARLCPRAGDGDAHAGQRARGAEPGELRSERGDVADDRDRRGLHAGLRRDLRDRRERAVGLPLGREGPALDDRDGLIGGSSAGDQLLGDRRQLAHAHVEDERAREGGDRRPVQAVLGIHRIRVAGDERHGARDAPMGDRDARVRARGDPGGDPGDDLERDAFGRAALAPPRRRGRRRTGRRPSAARRCGPRARARRAGPP